MEIKPEENRSNPLSDLISNEIFDLLNRRGFLNETSMRDRIIRKRFKSLRTKKYKVSDAIDIIREDYPYLQFETIRKIVHHPPKVMKKIN
ncbi:MAG: hypothetical protein WCE54_11920 [Ignavibacteriaceae bacterium]